MPQFAVFRGPSRDPDIPFVVQIQSSRLDRGAVRVVMALPRRDAASPRDHAMTPHLTLAGVPVYANPLNIATLPATRLGPVVAMLEEADQDRIIRAIDEMISRA